MMVIIILIKLLCLDMWLCGFSRAFYSSQGAGEILVWLILQWFVAKKSRMSEEGKKN